MKILVVNDDGINGEGLELLVEVAKEYGEVVVVAPKEEQSAKSHSITLRKGVKTKRVNKFSVPAYTVDSTPADCVRTAKYGLKLDFDIVFSGINRGYNLGEDITYSGTVAAIMEASFMDVPAIAFSTYYKTFEGAKYTKEAIDYIFDNKLLDICKAYNVNMPIESKGIKITRQGCTHFDTHFISSDEGYYQKGMPDFSLEREKEESDAGAIYNGYISITPVTTDRTDIFAYKKLKTSI